MSQQLRIWVCGWEKKKCTFNSSAHLENKADFVLCICVCGSASTPSPGLHTVHVDAKVTISEGARNFPTVNGEAANKPTIRQSLKLALLKLVCNNVLPTEVTKVPYS